MPVLVAAVVVLGLVSLVNLLLTLGVVRRLREHTSQLANIPGPTGATGPAIGSTVAAFATRTLDGEPITRDGLADQTLVAFFSPGCAPCEELRPAFVRHAATLPGGRERVLAVLTAPDGPGPDRAPGQIQGQVQGQVQGHAEGQAQVHAEAVAELAAVARVVVEAPGAELVGAAFGVRRYPTLCVVGADGRVVASGPSLTALRTPVPV